MTRMADKESHFASAVSFQPPHGVLSRNASVYASIPPSISWWILFIGCRVPVVFSVARGMEFYVSNFLGVSSRRFMKFVGSRAGLVIAQGKVRCRCVNEVLLAIAIVVSQAHSSHSLFPPQGWPSILFFYGCLSFLFETGNSSFARCVIAYGCLWFHPALSLFPPTVHGDTCSHKPTSRPFKNTSLQLGIGCSGRIPSKCAMTAIQRGTSLLEITSENFICCA